MFVVGGDMLTKGVNEILSIYDVPSGNSLVKMLWNIR